MKSNYGFFKEIVKEIGDDFTQLASDIDETERFIDTGSYISLMDSLVGLFLVVLSNNKITAIAGE